MPQSERQWWVATGVVAVALTGCSFPKSTGQPKQGPFKVSIEQTDHGVVINSDQPFAQIECFRMDFDRLHLDPHGTSFMTTVWSAACPDATDCMRAVTYGDRALRTKTEAQALKRTGPGEAYQCACYTRGDRGTGVVQFKIDSDGVLLSR